MKRGIIFLVLAVFLVLATTNIASAFFGFWRFFGGEIIDTEASQIRELTSAGYKCPLFNGTSISIRLMGSLQDTPSDFFIPSHAKKYTRRTISMEGKIILGGYDTTETGITCIKEKDGKNESDKEERVTVFLPNISLYSVSSHISKRGAGGSGGGAN